MATAPFPGMPTQAVTEHKFTVQATIDGATGEGKVSSTKELSITIQAGTSDISITSGSGTYTYGDTITLYGSIAASATPPASNGINAITEPAQNQVGLYLDDTQLATANVGEGGAFTLTYNTAQKGITPGEPAQTLTVEPSSASSTYGETLTIKVTPERSAANSINALTEQDTVELLTSEGTARRTASRSQ